MTEREALVFFLEVGLEGAVKAFADLHIVEHSLELGGEFVSADRVQLVDCGLLEVQHGRRPKNEPITQIPLVVLYVGNNKA